MEFSLGQEHMSRIVPTVVDWRKDTDSLIQELDMSQMVFGKLAKNFFKYRKFEDVGLPESFHGYMIARIDGKMKLVKNIGRFSKKRKIVKIKEFRRIFVEHQCVVPLEGWARSGNSYYFVYRYYDKELGYYISEQQVNLEIFLKFGMNLINGIKALNFQEMHIASSLVFINEDMPVIGFNLLDDKADYDPETPPNASRDNLNITQEDLIHYLMIKAENTKSELKNLIEIFKNFENIEEISDKVRFVCNLLNGFLIKLYDVPRFIKVFLMSIKEYRDPYEELKINLEEYQEELQKFFKDHMQEIRL